MIHLSSYHSNGLPTVVWSNKVNLIGEKVYKPKIHFCEHCNKPILIYGRLIPCKHVFCFSCATLCLATQLTINNNGLKPSSSLTPPLPGPIEPVLSSNTNHNSLNHSVNRSPHYSAVSPPLLLHQSLIKTEKQHTTTRNTKTSSHHVSSKNLDLHRSDSNHSLLHRETTSSDLSNMDESNSIATPTTIQPDIIGSPTLNGIAQQQSHLYGRGCHRCRGKALRVERNTLNSIFVCQVESCKRTYLSARDLQAHVAHRHSRNKSNVASGATTSGSVAAISSSPYISTSSLLHLSGHNTPGSCSGNHRQSTSNMNSSSNNHTNSPNNPQHKRERDSQHHHAGRDRERDRYRERDRERERDRFMRARDSYQRGRERERDSKEYHRRSLQRAAQWAEASAQMLEKGLTR